MPDAPTIVGSALLVSAGYCSVRVQQAEQGREAREASQGVVKEGGAECTDPSKVLV